MQRMDCNSIELITMQWMYYNDLEWTATQKNGLQQNGIDCNVMQRNAIE